jgi:hypothetical protein
MDGPDFPDSEQRMEQITLAKRVGDMIDGFNVRYCVVQDAGKTVVYFYTYDAILKRDRITKIQFEDLRKLYQNDKIIIGQDARGLPIVTRAINIRWTNAQSSDKTAQELNHRMATPAGETRGDRSLS